MNKLALSEYSLNVTFSKSQKSHYARTRCIKWLIATLINIYNSCFAAEFACEEDSHCNDKGTCNIAPRTCQCNDGWTEFFDCTFGKFQINRCEVNGLSNIFSYIYKSKYMLSFVYIGNTKDSLIYYLHIYYIEIESWRAYKIWANFISYRISENTFCWNYFFLNLEIVGNSNISCKYQFFT